MFIEGSSAQIDAAGAHIWWNEIGKLIKVVASNSEQTAHLTRAGYRYGTGAAYRRWRTASDEQRVREMADVAFRLVADGFHPAMVGREFAKVRQFSQFAGAAALAACLDA